MGGDDVETRVQKFCDAHKNTLELAITHNIISLSNQMLGCDGNKRLENGLRELAPVLNNSKSPAAAYEALQKIITGVTLVSVGAAYAEATKGAIDRERASEAGKNSGKIRREVADETWRPYALNLAVATRKENKAITQFDLAAKIGSRWALKIPCPKSMLISAISQWEREGSLPKRNKHDK
jgi:hypothetical protein